MFINMRQACGHWKIGENTYCYKMIIFNVTVLKILENMYIHYRYRSAKFVKNKKYCSIAEKR